MPFHRITIRPGINTMATQTANEGGWSLSNLIRFRQGFLEKIGGWKALFASAAAGIVRCLYAYEDLTATKNLVIGGDGGLQVYNGNLYTIQFARRSATTLYASTTLATITGTMGSASVTITDNGHGASVGDKVLLPVTISVGGIIISSQTVTVASVTDANNWVFTAAQNLLSDANTSGNYGTPPIFSITNAELNTTKARVTLPAHGLLVNQTFQVQFPVTWQTGTTGASVPAGTYTVASVVSSSVFTITTGITQTQTATGAEAGYDGTNALFDVVYFLSNTTQLAPTMQWYLDNMGGNVIIGLGGGKIYQFAPPVSTTGSAYCTLLSNAPIVNGGTFVAMPQAQIIAFASEATIGSGIQDPLMVRWSDAGFPNVWLATVTNQAGSFRLSRGSLIVGGLQAPQTTLLWTDIDLWSMNYIGPPLIYGFSILGTGCGLIAPKARATLGRTTYWMSQRGFYAFGDQGMQHIESPVWDTVFNNLNTNPAYVAHVFAGTDEPFDEVWFFYPSMSSSNGECDSYVKFNQTTNAWDYGSLSRTAWIGVSIFGMPLGADLSYNIQQHETGYDDNGNAMSGVYAETGFFDIGDGEMIPFLDQMIPDLKWFGANGSLSITVWGQNYPSDTAVMYGPYTIVPETQLMPIRVRQRQIAMRADWAATAGFSARFGAMRARIAPAGKRP